MLIIKNPKGYGGYIDSRKNFVVNPPVGTILNNDFL
jgi:hypothetical protein